MVVGREQDKTVEGQTTWGQIARKFVLAGPHVLEGLQTNHKHKESESVIGNKDISKIEKNLLSIIEPSLR